MRGSVGKNHGEWRLSLWKSPFSAFSFTVDLASVRLILKDHRGRTVPVELSGVEPSLLESDPRRQMSGEQAFRLRWNLAAIMPEMYDVSAIVSVRAADAAGQPITLPPVRVTGFRFYKTPEPDAAPALKPGQRFVFIPRYEPTADDLKQRAKDVDKRRASKKKTDERFLLIRALATLELPIPPELERFGPDLPALPAFRPQYQMPYVDAATGAPVAMRDVVLKVFTLEKRDAQVDGPVVLEFTIEGRTGRVRVACPTDVDHLPHLTPIVADSNLRRLRAKYEGKRVWFNGGGGFECVTLQPQESGSFGTEAKTPYRVRRLVRLYQPGQTLAIGGAPGYMGPRDSEFTFDNPILAIVDVPEKASLGGFMWSGFAMGRDENNLPGTARDLGSLCAGTVTTFADAWDMERECRTDDPRTVAQKWPARFRTAVAKGDIRKGMTPEMVVAVMGWPNEFAAPDEMRKMPAWRYDSTPPYNYWVNFRNGRVTSWGPDGRLP